MDKVRPLVSLLGDIVRTYQLKRVSRSAAEFAYFLTLSIFPLLICLVAILSSFDVDETDLYALIEGGWAADLVSAMGSYLTYVSDSFTPQMLVMAIVVIATSSSAAFRAVAKIMADIQGKTRYKGVFNLLASFIFSLLLLVTIYISVLMIATGGWLMGLVEQWTGIKGLAMVWQWLRFVVLFVVLVVVIHMIYLFTAPRDVKMTRLPGAVIASVALVVGSIIFSAFVGSSVKYPLIYGTLAYFILLMIWCYLCGNILITGNVINFALNKRKLHRFKSDSPGRHG